MNNNGSRSTAFCCYLKFVSPTPIIRHCLSAKHPLIEGFRCARVRHLRIIDQKQKRFSAKVLILEVIPLVFGSNYPVPDKNQFGIPDGNFWHLSLGPNDSLFRKF